MLSEDDIAAAVAAAEAALQDDDASWIRESGLRERAYRYGLCKGLSAIAPTSQLVQSLWGRAFTKTLDVRPGDEGSTISASEASAVPT